ncbi:hypothetical protein BDN70DRAFT_30260 [Pholiota conissans]|uniref:MYND-type domain-containing protein n=1 Tax=Pholiota conissans TaxID=109636 RepID=A0A9P5Z2N6_9AGAR|nr:hypothetical protein BDN70DRAFT_30260 [Pholiota conissans]
MPISLSSRSKLLVASITTSSVLATFGDHTFRFDYPFPLRTNRLQTRVARKSPFIEIFTRSLGKIIRRQPDQFVERAQCRGPGQPKLMACAACMKTRYCSHQCQKAHWKIHKPQCGAPLNISRHSFKVLGVYVAKQCCLKNAGQFICLQCSCVILGIYLGCIHPN